MSKVPEEYVTESELESKGYLTSHQNISHLATKAEVSEKANKTDLVDFATESFVTQEISKIPQYNDTEIREILKNKIEENSLFLFFYFLLISSMTITFFNYFMLLKTYF